MTRMVGPARLLRKIRLVASDNKGGKVEDAVGAPVSTEHRSVGGEHTYIRSEPNATTAMALAW